MNGRKKIFKNMTKCEGGSNTEGSEVFFSFVSQINYIITNEKCSWKSTRTYFNHFLWMTKSKDCLIKRK